MIKCPENLAHAKSSCTPFNSSVRRMPSFECAASQPLKLRSSREKDRSILHRMRSSSKLKLDPKVTHVFQAVRSEKCPPIHEHADPLRDDLHPE
mmetsp:Transcript_42032/g.104597  ORF Transcript_42032/g.104597 Transcript_42032/m.104597 type:complete len:94 (+) Transcript_42032:304-585(+)